MFTKGLKSEVEKKNVSIHNEASDEEVQSKYRQQA